MIETKDMIPLLLEASPSFASRWEDHRRRWKENSGLTTDLAEFAYHLVTLTQAKSQEEVAPAFTVIERFYIEGSEGVKKAATIGILDSAQNIVSAANVASGEVSCHLQPHSLRAWKMLEDFWQKCLDDKG